MNFIERMAWWLARALVVLAVLFLLSALAHADPPTLSDRVVAVQPTYQSHKDPAVDPQEFADAIVPRCKGSREWCAVLLTIAIHEAALSARIARGECDQTIRECDGGLAWGLFQIHKNERNREFWGTPDLKVQAAEASRLARAAFYRCQKSGVPFPLSTFRAYAGRDCHMPIRGEERRVQTYNQILRRL